MDERIYSPPDSDLGSDVKNKVSWKLIRALVYGFVSISLYGVLGLIIPQFNETFRSFGADLIPLTVLVIEFSPYFKWLAYISVIIIFIYVVLALVGERSMVVRRIIKCNFFTSIFVFIACLVLLYIPIVQIRQAV